MNLFADVRDRPYRFDDVATKSFRAVLLPRFWEVSAFVAAVMVVPGLFAFLGQAGQFRSALDSLAANPDDITFEQFMAIWGGRDWILTSLLAAAISVVVLIVLTQYVLRRVHQVVTGEADSLGATWRRALDPVRGSSLLVSGVAASILSAVGFFFCLLPGLVLSLLFLLLPACVVLSRERLTFPVGEPFRLMKGRFWESLGALFVMVVPIYVVSFVLSYVLQLVLIPGYMSSFNATAPGTTEAEQLRAMVETLERFFDSKFLIVSALSQAVVAPGYVLVAFATVIMVVNYRAFPAPADSSAGVPPPRTAS